MTFPSFHNTERRAQSKRPCSRWMMATFGTHRRAQGGDHPPRKPCLRSRVRHSNHRRQSNGLTWVNGIGKDPRVYQRQPGMRRTMLAQTPKVAGNPVNPPSLSIPPIRTYSSISSRPNRFLEPFRGVRPLRTMAIRAITALACIRLPIDSALQQNKSVVFSMTTTMCPTVTVHQTTLCSCSPPWSHFLN